MVFTRRWFAPAFPPWAHQRQYTAHSGRAISLANLIILPYAIVVQVSVETEVVHLLANERALK
ncbi:MAG: hypothetical protein A2W66_11470 [Deltaproteobacteria bacterium RIFCSPLOWO2_02_56_12]|nr:MAG: hypothetical protein A2W10_05655 [Deltaproteobacteria bacterium RBG_16_55_12]OGQ52036.1 MAG: hypothetical protein A2W66_11470 [Deltaproteobacteria bacterium RIFCSPLOWO2_02_56_12]